MKSYFRPEIDKLSGYVPGEQPKISNLIKLNTNENPYSPSPKVAEALQRFDCKKLKRYPDPEANALRGLIAERFNTTADHVICGNGSDDLLTMIFRSFTSPELMLAMPEPSYSLYAVLADMQGAVTKKIPLSNDFALPDDFLQQIQGCNLLALARPNAPTGVLYSRKTVEQICQKFDGIVLIDEAYADFAHDNCVDFALRYSNTIVMRTFSKSYGLAGLRLGYAISAPEIIEGLMKLKDSYNLDAITQILGIAAFSDQEYLMQTTTQIKTSRQNVSKALAAIGFKVIPSEANFIFAAPPDNDGKRYFDFLRENSIIVRYFSAPSTKNYVRITVGTKEENEKLLDVTQQFYRKNR